MLVPAGTNGCALEDGGYNETEGTSEDETDGNPTDYAEGAIGENSEVEGEKGKFVKA